jgi:protein TonB
MFESSLIALQEKKHRRRWAPLPIAVGLHLAVLASVGLAQVWDVGPVGDPELVTAFIELTLPPLPPPPLGGSRPVTTVQAPTTPTTPTTTVQPDTEILPDAPSTDPVPDAGPDVSVADGGSPFGSRDGIQGGVFDGVPGGDPNSRLTDGGIGWTGPVTAPQPQTEVVRFNGTMSRPVMLAGRQPRYTELARRAGTQGTVILEAVIDKKGRVSNVRILKGLPMGLDAEAVAAVQDWTFEPAKMDGRPVAVYYTLTVNFKIQR